MTPPILALPGMFATLRRCLTGVSSRCKADAGVSWLGQTGRLGRGGMARFDGDWVAAGDAALTGAPELMAGVKDALGESANEHGFIGGSPPYVQRGPDSQCYLGHCTMGA